MAVSLERQPARASLTFDSDLRHSFDDAEAAHGHAGVVGRFANAA